MSKVTVFAENFIKEECLDKAVDLFNELVEQTNKENGCITYSLYQDFADKTHFTFFEEWESKEALDAHMKTEHFTSIVPQVGEMSCKKGSFLAGAKFL